jgi:hypothetical protein
MELQHVNAKIMVEGDLAVDPGRFIDVFHRWIREGVIEGLLIDVADYRHVPDGPGVTLIGFDSDYSMDNAGGNWGVLYNRKSPLEGSNDDRLLGALKSAVQACKLLEAEFADDGLKFSRQKFELFINDRALAPNTDETWDTCQPILQSFLKSALGHDDFALQRESEPRRRFGVTVETKQSLDFDALAK